VDEGYDPLDYRYFLLGGHYRSQLQFSREALDGARNSRRSLLDRVRALAGEARRRSAGGTAAADGGAGNSAAAGEGAAAHLAAFNQALEEDLSSPRALAELWGLLRDGAVEPGAALRAAFDMDRALGLRLAEAAEGAGGTPEEDAEIEALIAERRAAKQAGNYGRADEIRRSLKERGIILEDGKDGTVWRRE
jgi:cysteinyl-tRNA synthetase